MAWAETVNSTAAVPGEGADCLGDALLCNKDGVVVSERGSLAEIGGGIWMFSPENFDDVGAGVYQGIA